MIVKQISHVLFDVASGDIETGFNEGLMFLRGTSDFPFLDLGSPAVM